MHNTSQCASLFTLRSLHLFLQCHAGGPVIVGYPGLLRSVWPALSYYPYL